jgi:hypothetical protein
MLISLSSFLDVPSAYSLLFHLILNLSVCTHTHTQTDRHIQAPDNASLLQAGGVNSRSIADEGRYSNKFCSKAPSAGCMIHDRRKGLKHVSNKHSMHCN